MSDNGSANGVVDDIDSIGDVQNDALQQQREGFERLEKLLRQTLQAVMARKDPPVAAVGATGPSRDQKDIDEAVSRTLALRDLKHTTLANGDIAYRLKGPLDAFVDDAFIERGVRGGQSHIEVLSKSEKAIEAAMIYAHHKWEGGPIKVHAGDKHIGLIVKHAVAHDLEIVNKEPHIQMMVAAEKERRSNPLLRDADISNTPLIERATATRSL